jgi:hypothetical protein
MTSSLNTTAGLCLCFFLGRILSLAAPQDWTLDVQTGEAAMGK